MGIVVPFRERHARASEGSFDASAIKSSDVKPDRAATSVRKIKDQYSAGILRRCHHLATVDGLAETSAAIASLEGQSDTTSRKVSICLPMPPILGPIVLKCKDILALDGKIRAGHTVPMAESETEAQYKQAFIARVKACRVAKGWKQWQMAEALGGMPQDKYKQYESRSYLPPHLIERFSLICGVNPGWLVTGRGEKALKPIHMVETEPGSDHKPKRQKRSKAA